MNHQVKSPPDLEQLAQDYAIVEKALRYLDENFRQQPSLSILARQVGLSEYHFQRLFTRWVGISPKRFLQFLTKEHVKTLLDQQWPLLQASYASGLSSPSRLYDLLIRTEAVTPAQYKTRGQGLTISYGFHPTPFGECLAAVTPLGLCHLSFQGAEDRKEAFAELQKRWPQAYWIEEPQRVATTVKQIFAHWPQTILPPLALHLNGTNFQLKVWEALLHIPPGTLTSYEHIAQAIGEPRAARAVGQAVAANPIALLIPCHRVIRKIGVLGNYGGGRARKKAILGWELAQFRQDKTSE